MRAPSIRTSAVLAVTFATLTLASCAAIPPLPDPLDPSQFEASIAPSFTPNPLVGPDGFTYAEHVAVRIRVETCTGYGTGSGWILSPNQVVTNSHVIDGATHIEVTDYLGRVYQVSAAALAPVADIALLSVDAVFTEAAVFSSEIPERGDAITVVGYPDGQELTTEEGTFIGETEDIVNATGETIWQFNAHIEPGSSGSGVFNDKGEVVAVVYAGDSKQSALAWPISWFNEAQAGNLWQPQNTQC